MQSRSRLWALLSRLVVRFCCEVALQDAALISVFDALEISVEDAWALFRTLDSAARQGKGEKINENAWEMPRRGLVEVVSAAFQVTSTVEDGDSHVGPQEFVDGCLRCKGPARAIDVVCIKRDLHTVLNKLESQAEPLESSLWLK